MSRRFVPFGKIEPNVLFEIHDQTWTKCPHTQSFEDIVYNAYSLDNTKLDSRNRGIMEVRLFDDATLVQIDTDRPPTKRYVEVLKIYDNDN